jgi:hypothetical protein
MKKDQNSRVEQEIREILDRSDFDPDTRRLVEDIGFLLFVSGALSAILLGAIFLLWIMIMAYQVFVNS